MPSSQPLPVRAITYLAPSIPEDLFRIVVDHLAKALERPVLLEVESRVSGPMRTEQDPFAQDRADLGFLCAPSYLYLESLADPSIELVPAGLVFADPRYEQLPVYFSDVVVAREHPASSFEDLAGASWGYNDECSLSGYFSALQRLNAIESSRRFFSALVRTGSHLNSLAAVAKGEIDAAAIDSNVLAMQGRAKPEIFGRLRVLESWGPFPIQPIVASRRLGNELRERICSALLNLSEDRALMQDLGRFDLIGFKPIDERSFDAERKALQSLGEI
ncbi:MAG: phosphate/phosphite/phosphonate ABC transporter substrate-binding protein [Planctomycetota bacterium]